MATTSTSSAKKSTPAKKTPTATKTTPASKKTQAAVSAEASLSPETFQKMVAEAAYYIAEKDGFRGGEYGYWLQGCEQILSQYC